MIIILFRHLNFTTRSQLNAHEGIGDRCLFSEQVMTKLIISFIKSNGSV